MTENNVEGSYIGNNINSNGNSSPEGSSEQLITGTTADGFQYVLDHGNATINGYVGSATELIIPARVDGYMVLEIYECFNEGNYTSVSFEPYYPIITRCFNNCTSLLSVNSATTQLIDFNDSFNGCINLSTVNFPTNYLGSLNGSFTDSPWLINARANENHPNIVIINNHILETASATGRVIIPEGVTVISGSMFRNNTNITSLEISSTVTSIHHVGFENCFNLATITLAENSSLTNIAPGAFAGTAWYNAESQNGTVYLNGIEIRN